MKPFVLCAFLAAMLLAPNNSSCAILGATMVAPQQLVERFWIDKVPEQNTDPFTIYLFDRDTEFGPLAFNVKGCPARFTVDIATFEHTAKSVDFVWLADNIKNSSAYKIEQIDDNGDFEFKLTIEKDPRHNNKPHVYYGTSTGRAKTVTLKKLLNAVRTQADHALSNLK